MHRQEHNYPQPYLASFYWRGMLAVGLLWMLAIWNIGGSAEISINNLGRSDVVATQDFRLHASGDYSLSVKRFYSRYQDQSSSLKLSDPHWNLHSTAITNLLLLFISTEQNPYTYVPAIRLYQLQVLNAPRAPPLV